MVLEKSFISTLYFRELREKSTTPILVNICVCLLAVYLLYVVGIAEVGVKSFCDAVAFLLHYFTLTSLLWMSVNAYKMHRAFSQVS